MKPDEKQQSEILQVYETWLHAYLNGDVKTYDSYFDDEYRFIGSTNNEEFLNREETTAFFTKTAEQLAGKTDLRNNVRTIEEIGGLVFLTHLFDAYFLNGSEWTYYGRFRFSSTMQKKGDGWKFLYQHFSIPDAKSEEGDTIGYDRVAEENQELREAIKRRTIELENKNKDLEIEAALERVRTVAMGMMKPDDLLRIAEAQYNELRQLGFTELRNSLISIFHDDKNYFGDYDYSDFSGGAITSIPYGKNPIVDRSIEQMKSATDAFTEFVVEGKDLEEWKTFRKQNGEYDDTRLKDANAVYYYFYSIEQGSVGISTFKKISGEQLNILKKFRNVFDLAYKRYVDIHTAEIQAKEARIEAALEKVRSRSLAMHRSDEIKDVVLTVLDKITELGIEMNGGVSLVTFFPGSKDFLHWLTLGADFFNVRLPYFDHIIYKDCADARENEVELFASVYSGDVKRTYFKWLMEQTGFSSAPQDLKDWVNGQPHFGFSFAIQKNSGIFLNDYTGKFFSKETNEILIRFSKVFEQSYVRFLDLQKAEAQAKEARIEAALEKVRSRSLAMHRSEELQEVVTTVFERLKDLGIETDAINLDVFSDNIKDAYLWTAVPGHTYSREFHIPYNDTIVFQDIYNGMVAGKELHSKVYSRKEKDEFLTYVFAHTDFRHIPEERKAMLFATEASTVSVAYAKHIAIVAQRYREKPFSDEENEILKRFAKVFEQAYTRFLDLKKAEAQTREAQIEASLERVRSKVIAMNNSSELREISYVFGDQMRQLKVDWQFSYFWLIEEEKDTNTFWITWPDNHTSVTAYSLTETDAYIRECLVVWKAGQKMHSNRIPPEGVGHFLETFKQLAHDAGSSAETVMKEANFQNGVYYYDAMMKYGSFGLCMNRAATDEESRIQCRFAIEFERAYTRFLDLKQAEQLARQAEDDLAQLKIEKKRTEEALAELQVTQKQLIQSEKMASLGELTAGIAHEIQNPLNFVNNFSEVSNELLDEMVEEVKKGNYAEVEALVNDVKQNIEKINHHGKRADGIVKGMLQHSRSSSGQKELTDINALADEYLRLAYHGLRAKDKTFNASMKTDFDATIGKVSIIPQDIGRVILNLITNAFYVVNEKKIQQPKGYEPVVSVSTKKETDKIEIRVKDNGNGIPPKVLGKIFQPFFTTKPTGQGTGLGLSLSYDIVKAHRGELKVTTKEGEGTEFIIQLPMA